MYQALIQSGDIDCDDYEHTDHGVELYEDGEFIAFVPYENLLAVVDESWATAEDRSIL
ncbi:hypothetical protein [Halopiger thermotolerans]